MESFGTRLADLRREHNLTQNDIADRLNISAQAVSKWENDLTSPDIDTLLKLSDIFNISVDVCHKIYNIFNLHCPANTVDKHNSHNLPLSVTLVDR